MAQHFPWILTAWSKKTISSYRSKIGIPKKETANCLIILLMEESCTWDVKKIQKRANNGINYQAQLVQDFWTINSISSITLRKTKTRILWMKTDGFQRLFGTFLLGFGLEGIHINQPGAQRNMTMENLDHESRCESVSPISKKNGAIFPLLAILVGLLEGLTDSLFGNPIIVNNPKLDWFLSPPAWHIFVAVVTWCHFLTSF